jgi:hypothetical protein
MEGFLLGQIMAPDNSINTGPAWRARAMREMARAQAAKEQAEKAEKRAEKAEKQVGNLTASLEKEHAALEKEHKRFLLERRERIGYMRGWAVRGLVLTKNCGYTMDRVEAEGDVLQEKYEKWIDEIEMEDNAKIDQEAGF